MSKKGKKMKSWQNYIGIAKDSASTGTDVAWGRDSGNGNGEKSATTPYVSCHKTHPPLKLGDKVVYGGSCIHPTVEDADVYIGLDSGMLRTTKSMPWTGIDEVQYFVSDGSIPKDEELFGKLVVWLKEQIEAGRKVHVGCIGGHGRTGMLLSALVSVMGLSSDPITYVRENYCKKAVESKSQVDFLVRKFGCKKVEGSKEFHTSGALKFVDGQCYSANESKFWKGVGGQKVKTNELIKATPMSHGGKIW